MSWTPTDEQVEEAADAIHKDGLWDLHYWARVRLARAVLVAVGPMIAESGWDEGYQSGRADGSEHEQMMQMRDWWGVMPTTDNPYRIARDGA